MASPSQEIRALTGLRGFAACLVMLYHFKFYNFLPAPVSNILHHGYLAVDLFFILSGFVMALTYTKYFSNGFTGNSYKSFLFRRMARVYPIYIATTLVSIIILSIYPEKADAGVEINIPDILANITMVQAWGFSKSLTAPAWSISTEFLAYLLFPLLLSITLFCSRTKAILTALMSSCILLALSLTPETLIDFGKEGKPMNIWNEQSFGPVLRCVTEFTIGILCYRLFQSENRPAWLQKTITSYAITGVIVLLLMIPEADIVIVALFAPLLVNFSLSKNYITQLFGMAPLYHLGLISYSLYLCHLMTYWIKPFLRSYISQENFHHSELMLICIQIVLSLAIATILYSALEKPARNFLRQFYDKPQSAQTLSP